MSQTDRQTDNVDHTNSKSTWWSIVCFNTGEQEFLAKGVYPEFVNKVYGGLEKCPDTGRTHFQGAVQCRSQQRWSAIKKMLPKANISPARSVEALKKYVMKEATSLGHKAITTNATPYWTMEMIMKLLAITPCPNTVISMDDVFWFKVNVILCQKPYLVGLLAKPDIYRMFKHTSETWILHMTDPVTNQLLDEGAIVLQPPASEPEHPTWVAPVVPDIIELESITDAQVESDDQNESTQESGSEEGTEESSQDSLCGEV